ncbi:MAG: glutamate formimidoyltransferase [Candidatus Margulisbacteria bacterium]|nr:glutamate formimidoyltransferase [Candidatus Margulisiibacteriota bacterium]
MPKLVECVPNFSEGTDLDLVQEIVAAVKTAKVIDLHSDPDHNRSVVTILGEPGAVGQAAFDLTERAMQLLDIKGHTGVHPFIGVVDVIPFIPIRDCTMGEAVDLARELGDKLWTSLQLPVYYYGEAAQIAERRELPFVRHGGYEALKLEINDPHRRPDVGQGLHPTAGAVAVGARNYLIAINFDLDTPDVDIARSIAKNIREKSGGLPGVRALGVGLGSRNVAQVTVNVVDHQKTSLKKLNQQVNKWAKEYGVGIVSSELVGLIPAAAVHEGIKDELKLTNFSRDKILDNYL